MLTACSAAALPVASGRCSQSTRQLGRQAALATWPGTRSVVSAAFSGCRTTIRAAQQEQRRQRGREWQWLQAMAGSGEQGRTKVLFVCLGNICRSPSAEAVFKNVVERAGVAGQFDIDSCGTGGGSSNWYLPGGFSYHEGDPADSRMTATARTRGITLTSRSRPLKPADLAEFDYIIGMDASNLAAIRRAAEHWRSSGSGDSSGSAPVPADYASKLSLMTDFLQSQQYKRYNEVPDPYYGGQKGFELVLDLLDDACQGLLQTIQQQQQQQQ